MIHWNVTRGDPATSSTVSVGGTAPDLRAAVVQAVVAARELHQPPDGAPTPWVAVQVDGVNLSIEQRLNAPGVTDEDIAQELEEGIMHFKSAIAEFESSAPPTPAAPLAPFAYPTPSGSVAEQWGRIAQWLADNTTAPQPVGAPPNTIADAETATGVTWPAELVQLYTMVNGFPHENWVQLLPQHELFDLDRLVEKRDMMIEIWGDLDSENDQDDEAPGQAGETAWTFLPEFLPFAGLDGYFLFVDTRPGPRHGCVTEFGKSSADEYGPKWRSLSAMLRALADSLRDGTPFDSGAVRAVEGGKLVWNFL